jgi:hypothetical protein
MRRISSPTAPNVFVAIVIVSAMSAGAGAVQARAEGCLAGPNASSPAGQHWYYRIDRSSRRKCWYLHAPLRGAHEGHGAAVLAHARIGHALAGKARLAAAEPMPVEAAPKLVIAPAFGAPVSPMPIANPPMPAADLPIAESAPDADKTPSLPQGGVLAVKTIAVRPPRAPAEARPRHHASGAPISEESARAYMATPGSKSDPTMFFFLVFGLGLATFVIAIVLKRFTLPSGRRVRPAGEEAGIAWQDERVIYSAAGPAWFRDAPSRRKIDRRTSEAQATHPSQQRETPLRRERSRALQAN